MSALSLARRRDVAELQRLASSDLTIAWRQFATADDARDGLIDVLPQLMGTYGSAAATLAAEYYDEARDAAGAKGRFRAIPAGLPDVGRTEALARWAVTPLYSAQPDFTTAFTKVGGGLQRIIADAARETVVTSAVQDSRGGWMRVGSGSGCDWCAQYIDGEVHYTGGYDFDAHDWCNCDAVEVFD